MTAAVKFVRVLDCVRWVVAVVLKSSVHARAPACADSDTTLPLFVKLEVKIASGPVRRTLILRSAAMIAAAGGCVGHIHELLFLPHGMIRVGSCSGRMEYELVAL